MDKQLSYPEDFNEAIDSMTYLPEELRPILMNVYLNLMTFGLY